MKRWLAGAGLAMATTMAAGCLAPRGESAPVHTYQLSLEGWSAETHPASNEGPVLLVQTSQAEPGFDTPRMAYLKRRYEVEYYATSQWADEPAHLFSPLLVSALSRSGAWRAVVPSPSSVRGDYRLDSSGFAVRQEFFQQPSRVRMTVRIQLVELKESRIVGGRFFETVEDAPTEDAYGGVVAANRATATLLGHIVPWAEDCLRRPSECDR